MPTFSGQVSNGRILLHVHVGPPGEPPNTSFRALLDTGATISGITLRVVEHLDLTSGEWLNVGGIHGSKDAPTYKVALVLPITEPAGTFGRGDMSLEVAELDIPPDAGFDVLLGMDFLQQFHLTLYGNTFILSN